MKALIHILLFCFPVITFAQGQNSTNEITRDAQAVFGRHSKDCKGRGLCSFTTEDISKSQVNSQITYTESSISLTIYRDKITTEDEIKIAGSLLTKSSNTDHLTFTMYDDFESIAIQQLNSTTNQFLSIPKGIYPIEVTKNTFIINFNLE